MGAVCCISAKGATTSEGANGEILRQTIQYSPSWGVRWDNRGRVAGEDAPAAVIVDRVRRNGWLENKSEPFFEPLTEVEMTDENLNANPLKLPLSTDSAYIQPEVHVSGLPEARSVSMEVIEIVEIPAGLGQTLPALPDMPCASSLSTSPLPHINHIAPTGATPLKWSPPIPRSHFLRQGSDGQLRGHKSPSCYSTPEGRSSPLLISSSIESVQGSHGGSVEGWSVQSFPESTTSSRRETWSLNTDSLGPQRYNLAQSHSRKSDSHSNELKTCVVCSKYVDVYAVAAILVCGHVYHADCLEYLTPEISKYDPPCPVCTVGEHKAMKMLSKKGVFPPSRGSRARLGSSSSLRSSFTRPFLKRHFSLSSKESRSRSLLWSKSSKA